MVWFFTNLTLYIWYKKFDMKFGIGTAQLNKKYGFLKKSLSKKNYSKFFFELNKNKKITLIDTSPSYGNAEVVIGKKIKNKNIKISTKISKFDKSIKIKKIEKSISLSLKNLKRKNIDYLLFHDEKDIKMINSNVSKYLDYLKKNKIVLNIGLSVYDIDKIENYQKKFHFDFFQIPLNIFNVNKKRINHLLGLKKKYKIKFHARSVFLQGLALEQKVKSNKFKNLNKKINQIKYYEKKFKLNRYNILINAIINLNLVEYIIVGCSSVGDLKKLISFKKKKFLFPYEKFYISKKKEIDPRYW